MLDMSFRGAAKRLDDIDLPRIGAEIGVGEDELHAFMDVEAAGSGFDSHGRPKMLRETYHFWLNLPAAKRPQAISSGLGTTKWVRNYPSDSYPDLTAMIAIDETAALKSCSWGLGQIMGENHRMLGYDTVQDMVIAFMADEENHLQGIVDFLKADSLADDLKAHRWQALARGYNGPSYAANQYDVRLERAFAKWAKIPDTPWEGQATIIAGVAHGVVRRGSKGSDVTALQQKLAAAGYTIVIDGDFGPSTEGVVKTFQARSSLVADGIVGPKTWAVFTA